jgi:WD40 repeat protein
LEGNNAVIRDVVFSPDGKWLACAADRAIRIWDLEKKLQVKVLEGHTGGVYSLGLSKDGKLLASGSMDGTARLWDTTTWGEIGALKHGTNVYSVAFTPDGTRLACACANNTIRLWDIATRQQVVDLRGHKSYVHAVAFSPDGNQLVSGSGDHTLRIWDSNRP